MFAFFSHQNLLYYDDIFDIFLPMSSFHFASPWLEQLKKERPQFRLEKDHSCDIVVIGAGIAGVSTTYQILKNTSSSVLLIDAGRIAHGASGRNAGQVVNCSERSFSSITEEFGVDMAIKAHLSIESAWGILDDMLSDCGLQTPLYKCVGYTGLTTLEDVIEGLNEQYAYVQSGLKAEPMLLSLHANLLKNIPAHLQSLITEVPHSTLLHALCTEDPQFIAASSSPIGCINSSLLCEELVAWMVKHFPDRLTVAEHAPVTDVILLEDHAKIHTANIAITSKKVVLCTNGFENFTIEDLSGDAINPSFHRNVAGRIAYMTGYLDAGTQDAAALSYNISEDLENTPYYYLTRRPYEHTEHGKKTLLCIGGPERDLPNDAEFDPNAEPPESIVEDIERIGRDVYHTPPSHDIHTFVWQGLMGHTPNRIRRIGAEPRNPVLLYNLGCNGVGILGSIYGGKRIAELVQGIHLPPSIFDPK
jgi:glycine/D-amino acid oxidase-like deaminating enzyme